MKRCLFTILFALFAAFTGFCQNDTTADWGSMSVSAGLGFGNDFFGNGFFSDNLSVDYAKQLNPKVGVRLGASVGEIQSDFLDPYDDKTPYSRTHRRTGAYAGFDYAPNSKMLISATVFFDNLNLNRFDPRFGSSRLYAHGINANFTYKFSNEARLHLSFTFVESNVPCGFYSPYSIGCNPYSFDPYGCSSFGMGGFYSPFTSSLLP